MATVSERSSVKNGWVEELKTLFKVADVGRKGRVKLFDFGNVVKSICSDRENCWGSDKYDGGSYEGRCVRNHSGRKGWKEVDKKRQSSSDRSWSEDSGRCGDVTSVQRMGGNWEEFFNELMVQNNKSVTFQGLSSIAEEYIQFKIVSDYNLYQNRLF